MKSVQLKLGTIGICLDARKFSFLEGAIENFTGDGHHVFMVTDITPGDEKIIESHASLKGVKEQPLSKLNDGTIVLMVEPNFLVAEQIQVVVDRAKNRIGSGYDLKNLFGKIFRANGWFNNKERLICSELISYAYLPFKKFLGKEPEYVSPNDILRDVVYTGSSSWGRYVLSDWYNQPK